ncbi:zinc finger protein Yan [Coniochaeta ligniaria NRRL 30616]|uniref:Zinc finger protein Yan n=1 Tax=Coniochaeta ligniaria NRRL 30616 TaxID=1408157 RepID=A0A1J7J4Y9_9PEZI|nr:zinc finger protein Yan [Coniochaeta ligniaria NRRL 30616]
MDTTTSHPYTCNTCQVAFRNSDLQKGHMRSDWHRYNLKRRVASLPPISSEVFTEKVLQARATTSAEADKASFERLCSVCQKTYFSENSFRNHIGSSKHKAREQALLSNPGGPLDDASSMVTSTFSLGDPVNDDKTEVDSDAEEEFNGVIEGLKKTGLNDMSPIRRPSNPGLSTSAHRKEDHLISGSSASVTPSSITPTPSTKEPTPPSLKTCLFCNYDSPSPDLNAHHMEKIHGMFVPEKQYLVDLDGLLSKLQQQVFELHECLYCGKIKADKFAVQTHMRDIGHCKIPYSSEAQQLDIGEFYDFRSTYSDDEDSEDDESMTTSEGAHAGGAKLGAKRPSRTTGEDGQELKKSEEDGWETDSSASSLDSEDLHAVPAEQHYHQYERLDKHPHHTQTDPRSHHQRDGWHSRAHKHAHAVFYDEYEMHLPNGKSVGHRSFNKYFRQNLHSHPSPEERAERLAIEAAEREDDMDVDDEEGQQVDTRDGRHGRALIARGDAGLAGVSDDKKRAVRKEEGRARKLENFSNRRNQWSVNKQANHQKYYHYSIL